MKVQIRPAGFARSEGEDIEGRSEAGLEEGTVYTCSGVSSDSMPCKPWKLLDPS
jgi:hypothetical protein